jgi:hypothetical protein
VPCYLVESYLPATAAAREQSSRACRIAGNADDVRYLRTTFVPGDEIGYHLFEAPSPALVERAIRRAELPYERIVEALESPPERRDG